MAENSRVESSLKILSAVLAGSAFAWGVVQYNATRREEFRRHFWDQQFALYQEAAGAAAEIAMATDLNAAAAARNRFWILYWGKLSMVEHREVEVAMIAFGRKLSECEAGTDATCFSPTPGSVQSELRQHAFRLAHCAQLSLSKTWQPLELYRTSKCPVEYTVEE